MKTLSLLALALFLTSSHALLAQGNKVATVDMERVFKEHPRTKQAEVKFNETKNVAKKEFDEKADAYKKALDDINKIKVQLDAPTLSAEAKTAKAKEREDKIAGARTMERDIDTFRQTREKEFQQEVTKVREEILKEIMDVVMERVKANELDYVFDKSGQSMNGISPVLYARDNFDLTTDVVTAMGKTVRSSAATATPAKAASSPATSPKKP